MQLLDNRLLFSATDLSHFLACPHLTTLNRTWKEGGKGPPKYDDPALEVLWKRGLEHEAAYLEGLQALGLSIEVFDDVGGRASADEWRGLAESTTEAMRRGVDVVFQGVLFSEPWLGKPDFLRRVEVPSLLGDWSYEVVDTKLAREAKAGAVLQITFYSELLSRVQERDPEWMTLALGGPSTPEERFRYADFAAYFRMVCGRFLKTIENPDDEVPVAPDPCDHCTICAWKSRCAGERRDVDHLSLVAGINRKQRTALAARGVDTLAGLAHLPLPIEPPLEGASRTAAERIREQARIQLEGREGGETRYEFLEPIEPDRGFCILPPPSGGDLFFDFEGDPHFQHEGLEYLFGWVDLSDEYTPLWALDRAEEKRRFEEFVDFVVARREEYPDLHIYHYAPYEPSALKRLMGRHGTREDEVDRLLTEDVFVDLYRVVRQGLRASVESYSIKKLEAFYGFDRDVDLRRASSALAHFEAWLALDGRGEGDRALLDQIQGYNADDCISTLRLRDWLEERRVELGERLGADVPRPTQANPEGDRETPEHLRRTEAAVDELTHGVPFDPVARSDEEHARWLLAQLLNWHRREKKSTWWQYYTWLEMTDEELVEDRSTLGALEYEGEIDTIKRSVVHRYRFPRQEHSIKVGDTARAAGTGAGAGTVVALDEVSRSIDLRKGKRGGFHPAQGLLPLDNVHDQVLRDSLLLIAEAVLAHGIGGENPFRAAMDLLLRQAPRVGQPSDASLGEPPRSLAQRDELPLEAVIRVVGALDRSVLPIQGPPGAGKTYTGARAILALLASGIRVGICATSHKVIGNLLDEVCDAGRQARQPVRGIQKTSGDNRCASPEIEIGGNDVVRHALATGEVSLAAGTAWLWSREDMRGSVDVLVIDEAGQFSLANALAVAPAANSLVLLGDPRQLEQPQRGVHPPGADVSALDHLLGGEATISADRGLFLPETWRLHPDITAFTSELFYRGRLGTAAGVELQDVTDGGPVAGSGLRWISVEHTGNQNESREEVEAIRNLVVALIAAEPIWTDREGTAKPLGLADILIVAPYNAQVATLKEVLGKAAGHEVRVGTVDKFQGQEAPIVIYSMTSSSPEDAPRGMDFLYSPNRLNVATSRAKCLAVVVGNDELFAPECRSPKQMRLANAFCRLREMAG